MTNGATDASPAAAAPAMSAGDLVAARVRELAPRLEAGAVGLRSSADHRAGAGGSDATCRPRAADSSVHDLRVVVRELRSVLAAFRRVLATGQTQHVAGELRWLSGELAPVRDAEVLHERFELLVAGGSVLDVRRPAVARFSQGVAMSYADGLAQAAAALDSRRFRDLVTSLGMLERADSTAVGKDSPRRIARVLIRREVTRLVETTGVALSTLETTDRNLGLHSVRKQARRLRYAAEAAVPVVGAPARRLVRRAAKLQTILGTQHDSVLAAQALAQAAREDGSSQADRLALGRLATAELEYAAAAERRFVESWDLELPRLDRWVRHRQRPG